MDEDLPRPAVPAPPGFYPGVEGGPAAPGLALGPEPSDDTLRAWTGKLIEAQEEERTRISRELHDGVNQQAAMLAVELGMLARDLPPEGFETLRQRMLELRNRAEELSNEIRRVSHQLHPAILEHVGLIPALRSQCREFGAREGIPAEFIVGNGIANVPMDTALSLYRVTQEALRNVAKHSQATQVCLKLMRHEQAILLTISDNGKGFDTGKLARSTGLGHISMLERARLVGGALMIRSREGGGTEVMVQVRLSNQEGA